MKKQIISGIGASAIVAFSLFNFNMLSIENDNIVANLMALNTRAMAQSEICVGEICYWSPGGICISWYQECPDLPPEIIDDYWD